MADNLPPPSRWRRYRRRQVWQALFLFVLALLGLLSAVGGYTTGLVLVPIGGSLGVLSVLNAHSGRRGGSAARLVVRNGATYLEFPAHRLGTLLLLVIVVLGLALAVLLTALFAWNATRGSIVAGLAAVSFGTLTGRALYAIWADPSSRQHRGWPAVRLGAQGVELTGLFGGWFMPWDTYPVPSPSPNGLLHLLPLRAVHDLAQPLPEPRKDRSGAVPESISPVLINADLTIVAASIFLCGREPERRAELTTPTGLHRVHSGDLPVPWPPGI